MKEIVKWIETEIEIERDREHRDDGRERVKEIEGEVGGWGRDPKKCTGRD